MKVSFLPYQYVINEEIVVVVVVVVAVVVFLLLLLLLLLLSFSLHQGEVFHRIALLNFLHFK